MPNNQKGSGVQNKQLPLRINVALWEKLQQAAAPCHRMQTTG